MCERERKGESYFSRSRRDPSTGRGRWRLSDKVRYSYPYCLSRLKLHRELPPLDPGDLPPGYFDFDAEKPEDGIPPTRDFEAEILESVSSIPSPPEPPELGKDGKKLTKKEVKAVCFFI